MTLIARFEQQTPTTPSSASSSTSPKRGAGVFTSLKKKQFNEPWKLQDFCAWICGVNPLRAPRDNNARGAISKRSSPQMSDDKLIAIIGNLVKSCGKTAHGNIGDLDTFQSHHIVFFDRFGDQMTRITCKEDADRLYATIRGARTSGEMPTSPSGGLPAMSTSPRGGLPALPALPTMPRGGLPVLPDTGMEE